MFGSVQVYNGFAQSTLYDVSIQYVYKFTEKGLIAMMQTFTPNPCGGFIRRELARQV